MSGNTNPNKLETIDNFIGDFSSLSVRAQAYIQSIVSSLAIGAGVSGGTAQRVLFIDSLVRLAEDAGFTYDEITNILLCSIIQPLVIEAQPGNNLFLRVGSGFAAAVIPSERAISIVGLISEFIQPPQILGNSDNYNPASNSGGVAFRLTSDAAYNITGLVWANDSGGGAVQSHGLTIVIINVGAFALTLTHEDAASVATNRFLNSTGANIVLAQNQAADAIYDASSQRWRVFKRN